MQAFYGYVFFHQPHIPSHACIYILKGLDINDKFFVKKVEDIS